MTVPRRHAARRSPCRSLMEGIRLLILVSKTARTSLSAFRKISPMPKTPMTTGTMPKPSSSSVMPKVKRGAPITGSMPTMAIIRPKMADISARTSELAGETRDQGEAHEHQGEELGRAELEGQGGQRQGHQHQAHGGDSATDEGADGRDGQGSARPPLLGHLVALEAGDGRGRLAGDVHQHRGDGAAVHGTVVDGRQHDDGRGGVQDEGDGDQDGRAGGRPDPGQHADQGAQEAADHGEDQVVGCRAVAKPPISNPRLSNGYLLEPEHSGRQWHFQPLVEHVEDTPAAGDRHQDGGYEIGPAQGEQQEAEEDQHGEPEADLLQGEDDEYQGQQNRPDPQVADSGSEEVGGHGIRCAPGGVVEHEHRQDAEDPGEPHGEEAWPRAEGCVVPQVYRFSDDEKR